MGFDMLCSGPERNKQDIIYFGERNEEFHYGGNNANTLMFCKSATHLYALIRYQNFESEMPGFVHYKEEVMW
jgi:hypothetical protein